MALPKNYKWCFLAVSLCILVLAGCSGTMKNMDVPPTYFNLKGFMQQETARLDSLNPAIVKTIYINGNTETDTLTIEQWDKELAPFGLADINKPAWLGKYTTDTLQQNDSTTLLRYVADDAKLKTRLLEITRVGETVNKVKVTSESDNILYGSTQHMTYQPDVGYLIEGYQKINQLESDSFFVEATFLEPSRPQP